MFASSNTDNFVVKLSVFDDANIDLRDKFVRTALICSSKNLITCNSIKTVKLLIYKIMMVRQH